LCPKAHGQENEKRRATPLQDDIGAAYALEFLSYHIEASYLPGEDAAFVYDMTSYYISQNGDAARGTVEPAEDEPDSSAF
jgi:hypothetical protein